MLFIPRFKPWKGVGSPKLQYPLDTPSNDATYELEAFSPRVGKYYRVMNNDGSQTVYGFLDHVARMKTGAVVGYIFSPNGIQVGCKPITKHAVWYRLVD